MIRECENPNRHDRIYVIFLSEILVNPVTHYPYFLILALDDGEIVQHHEQFDIGHHLLVLLGTSVTHQSPFHGRIRAFQWRICGPPV